MENTLVEWTNEEELTEEILDLEIEELETRLGFDENCDCGCGSGGTCTVTWSD